MTKTKIVDIRNHVFAPAAIEADDFVVWRNLDAVPHTVETAPDASFYFNVGPLATGEVSSPVWFGKPGKFPYLCRYHADMTGEIEVVARGAKLPQPAQMDGGHHDMPGHDMPGHGGHDLLHFHGFVTGGRSGTKLYMSHTPVIADDRHRFQVILRSSFVEQKHRDIYDKLRASSFGAGKVQIFHDHLSLVDIGDGTIKDLPQASVEYYPPESPDGIAVPGLEENIPVRIDRVLHFHQFDPDASYPLGLRYLVYGDADDVFMDHHIIGAPSFHSVAKLKDVPAFWEPTRFDGTAGILIPEKRIVDVSPKVLRKVAFVDNAYHLAYLPPSGAYRQPPPDPLIRRDGTPPIYDVTVDGAGSDRVTIDKFIHFDVALLNNRVVIA
ncbi:hypothetical protein [Bradyrhizobium sp. CB2312]|uniref:hypothetical protein n=1 Tax=Bradyrhizobium sp. CB2312 TaxID=3039155 RepID=UPI0024B09CFB|nr:hypothetical protein [Bradyrhizobium sp. CB2312]WFU71080.1 hypothetical protein QA642_38390 [Bradyrhizobium sp. CB2312]